MHKSIGSSEKQKKFKEEEEKKWFEFQDFNQDLMKIDKWRETQLVE